MLSDYIQSYIEAKKNADKPKMQQIERELRRLGMDIVTLETLARELGNNQ